MERKYRIIKLTHLSPMHLGLGKDEYSSSSPSLDSDILSSAIASVRAQITGGDDTEEFLSSFTLSNTFPYSKDTLFLPKPLGRTEIIVDDSDEAKVRKKLKKIRFLDICLWKELLSEGKVHVKDCQIRDEYLISDNCKEFRKPYSMSVNQRATVTRDGVGDTVPFFFEWLYFKEEMGLYFIVDSSEETFAEVLKYTKELGEAGIGSDKNVGGGHFDAEAGELSLPVFQDGKTVILLSTYIPSKKDLISINLSSSVFSIIHRTGFMAGSSDPTRRHFYRKSIYMMNCGSCLKTESALEGKVVDLRPDSFEIHPVFRNGKPLYISMPNK